MPQQTPRPGRLIRLHEIMKLRMVTNLNQRWKRTLPKKGDHHCPCSHRTDGTRCHLTFCSRKNIPDTANKDTPEQSLISPERGQSSGAARYRLHPTRDPHGNLSQHKGQRKPYPSNHQEQLAESAELGPAKSLGTGSPSRSQPTSSGDQTKPISAALSTSK